MSLIQWGRHWRYRDWDVVEREVCFNTFKLSIGAPLNSCSFGFCSGEAQGEVDLLEEEYLSKGHG